MNYPKGIPTWMISGNHDESLTASSGIEIVKEIAKEREDITYLGRYSANVMLQHGSTTVNMHHAAGGVAYALSYKMQKYIESMAPDEKPQVYLLGHYHTTLQMFLRNIHGVQLGCFQAQTPYLKRKKLDPSIGGHIIEYEVNATDGWTLKAFRAWFIPFYKPIKDDYKNYPL